MLDPVGPTNRIAPQNVSYGKSKVRPNYRESAILYLAIIAITSDAASRRIREQGLSVYKIREGPARESNADSAKIARFKKARR